MFGVDGGIKLAGLAGPFEALFSQERKPTDKRHFFFFFCFFFCLFFLFLFFLRGSKQNVGQATLFGQGQARGIPTVNRRKQHLRMVANSRNRTTEKEQPNGMIYSISPHKHRNKHYGFNQGVKVVKLIDFTTIQIKNQPEVQNHGVS